MAQSACARGALDPRWTMRRYRRPGTPVLAGRGSVMRVQLEPVLSVLKSREKKTLVAAHGNDDIHAPEKDPDAGMPVQLRHVAGVMAGLHCGPRAYCHKEVEPTMVVVASPLLDP